MVTKESSNEAKDARWLIVLITFCVLLILAGIAGTHYVITKTETSFQAQQDSIASEWRTNEEIMKLVCRIKGDSAWAMRFIRVDVGKTGVGSGVEKVKPKSRRRK